MNCPNCGVYNNEGTVSCTNCGSNLMSPQPNDLQKIHNEVSNDTKKVFTNKKIIIISLVSAIIIIGLFFIFRKNKDKNKSTDFDVNYTDAFFIEEDGNYALFNNDGKRLTEFEFSSVDDFINGTALVRKDDQYGVINSKGKMVIDFGKYKEISSRAGLYEVVDENDNEYLVNGNGKVLYDMKNMSLDTFIEVDLYSILTDKDSNTYKVLNYEGKVLYEFKINNSDTKIPSTNVKDNFMSVFYNNKNYIYNLANSKEVVSFDSDKHYCINDVEEDGKIITLNSCVGFLESQDKTYYKFIKDGKAYDLSDECERVGYSDDNLFCYSKSNEKLLIDGNGKVGINIQSLLFSDNDTYIKDIKNGVEVYNKGKVVKEIECRDIPTYGYEKSGIFVLTSSSSSKCGIKSRFYEYYKSNGELAIDKQFKKASSFYDEAAIVSEDGDSYYLINKSGKKLSDNYSKISYDKYDYKGFFAVEKDDLKGVIDKNGKELVTPKYSSIKIQKVRNNNYAILETEDSKHSVVDLKNGKELVTSDNSLYVEDNYIYEYNRDTKYIKYYTLSGKSFYETK